MICTRPRASSDMAPRSSSSCAKTSGGVEGTHAKTGVAQLLTLDAVRLERFFEWWPAGSPPSSFVGLNFCRSNAMEIHSNAERRFAPLARDVVDVALVVRGNGALIVVLVLRTAAELRGLVRRRAWRSC